MPVKNKQPELRQANLSSEEMKLAITKIDRRIIELGEFDAIVDSINDRYDPRIGTLHTKLEALLASIFGVDTIEYQRYHYDVTTLDTAYMSLGEGPSIRELAGQTNFKNIDLDHFFQIYRQEKNKEANLSELLSFVLERVEPPYIINHADLLNHDLSNKADMVILLNPKKEEQIKSRLIRQENKTDGEWQNVSVDDYDKISQNNLDNLAKTKGKIVYNNDKSGTLVKSLEK